MNKEAITLEKIDELYEYLQGVRPKCLSDKCYAPKLSGKRAFEIILFLQEITGCLPQKYERCSTCGEIYNSESEGLYSELNAGHYCGCCMDYPPVARCWDCGEHVWAKRAYSEKYDEYLCGGCKKERNYKKKEAT